MSKIVMAKEKTYYGRDLLIMDGAISNKIEIAISSYIKQLKKDVKIFKDLDLSYDKESIRDLTSFLKISKNGLIAVRKFNKEV